MPFPTGNEYVEDEDDSVGKLLFNGPLINDVVLPPPTALAAVFVMLNMFEEVVVRIPLTIVKSPPTETVAPEAIVDGLLVPAELSIVRLLKENDGIVCVTEPLNLTVLPVVFHVPPAFDKLFATPIISVASNVPD